MDFFTGIILASSVGAIAMRTQNQRNMIVLISFNNVEHNLIQKAHVMNMSSNYIEQNLIRLE